MLIYIIGTKGSGKTLLEIYYALRTKRNIYSNIKIELPNYTKLEIIDLLDLPNKCIIIMDEIYNWLESRSSGADLNIYIGNILFHSRKTFLDIFGSAVMYSTADKRFRLQADIIIEAKPRLNQYSDDFVYLYHYTNYNMTSVFTLPYSEAEKYLFPLYNTYEKVESSRKSKLEYGLISQNPNHLLTKVKELSKFLKPQLNKITHDSIKMCLLLNGIHIGYEKYIYLYLKEGLNVDIFQD